MTSNYYQLLEIPTNADLDTIKAAYRKLAKKFHPDLNPDDPDAEEYFKRINEAYKVLTDPIKRHNYDVLYVIRVPRVQASGDEHTFFGSSVKVKEPSVPSSSVKTKPRTTAYSKTFTKDEARKPQATYKLPKIRWRELPYSHYIILIILVSATFSLQGSDKLFVSAKWAFLLVYVFVSSLWINGITPAKKSKNSLSFSLEVLLTHLLTLPISAVLSLPLIFLIWFFGDFITVLS